MDNTKRKNLSKKELRRIPQAEKLSKVMTIERSLMGLAGAWICRLQYSEFKYMSARHLWEWAEHVNEVRHRLSEMPGGKPDAGIHKAMEYIIRECLFAPDEISYMTVLYTVLLPAIEEAYVQYMKKTEELPDRPSYQLLAAIVSQLRKQQEEALLLIQGRYPSVVSQDLSEWAVHILTLLDEVGGISGDADDEGVYKLLKYSGSVYTFPELPHRAPDAHCTNHFPGIDGIDNIFTGEVELDRVVLGVWLYNELDAAEYIPSILYEIKGMPWEFYYDVARHTWDEARHSEFGYRLLPKLGFEPGEFEMIINTYARTMRFKPHERYAAVTLWYEPGSFEVKPDFMEKLAAEIDDQDLAVELLRFDLADETMHVRFGHKWVPKLMELYKEQRTVEEMLAELKDNGLAFDQELNQSFCRTMPASQRLTVEKVKARVQQWRIQRGSRVVALSY